MCNKVLSSGLERAEIVTITPSIAEEWLKKNIGNRQVSSSVVSNYAKTMQNGGWYLNGEPITFDTEGFLTNGQHRLYAVIKSGVSIQSFVVYDVMREAFASYDCGRSRTLGQLIGMSGVKNYNLTAAVVNSYRLLSKGNASVHSDSGRFAASRANTKEANDDLIRYYNDNKEMFDKAGENAAKMAREYKKAPITASTAATIWLYLVNVKGYDEKIVSNFFNQLYNKLQPTNHVITLLWLRFNDMRGLCYATNQSTERQKFMASMDYKLNLLVQTWNYYVLGKDVKTLSYKKDLGRLDFLSFSQVETLFK